MKKKDQKKEIQKYTMKKLQEIDAFLAQKEVRQIKNDFLEKYMISETACKVIILQYQKATGKKSKKAGLKGIELQMKTIKAAIKFAGYPISDSMLDIIFGASEKRNQKSCKKLRNAIVHMMSVKDIQEVVDRHETLNAEMQQFLEIIYSPSTTQSIAIVNPEIVFGEGPKSGAA